MTSVHIDRIKLHVHVLIWMLNWSAIDTGVGEKNNASLQLELNPWPPENWTGSSLNAWSLSAELWEGHLSEFICDRRPIYR